jgi:hypothetical protein
LFWKDLIASSIFCEAFPFQKGFGEFLSFSFISISSAKISAVFSIIFHVSVPVKRFAPSLTVSGHSVVSRSFMHALMRV